MSASETRRRERVPSRTDATVVEDITAVHAARNLVREAVDDRTFVSSRLVNGVINERTFAIGHNGAEIASSQTYSHLTPPFDFVEWLMPDLL
jgi:hypothetical protein